MEVSKPPPLRGAPLMGRHPPQILPLREDFSEGLVLLEHPPQILPLREDFSEGLVLLELYANKNYH